MTPAEQLEYVKDEMEVVRQEREGKALAKRTLPISIFHDCRATLDSVEETVSTLYSRSIVFDLN